MRKNAYANRLPAAGAAYVAAVIRDANEGPRFPAPRLIVLAGLPGSGKSTLASALRLSTGVTVLESDRVRKLLFPRPAYLDWEHRKVFGLIRLVAEGLLARGHPAVIDATNLRRSDRRSYYALAARFGVAVTLAWVEAPDAVIRRRLSAPAAGDRLSDAGIDVYESMRHVMQVPDPPFILVDTSQDTRPALALLARILHES